MTKVLIRAARIAADRMSEARTMLVGAAIAWRHRYEDHLSVVHLEHELERAARWYERATDRWLRLDLAARRVMARAGARAA